MNSALVDAPVTDQDRQKETAGRRAANTMRIAVFVARVLLALVFIAAGASGFFLIHNPPPAPPGLAGAFQDVFFRSYWVLFVDGIELIAGLLLVTNRFVPLALVVLAAILTNMFIFHITMMPIGLPAPLFLTILWFIVAWPLRKHFAPLLSQRAFSLASL